MFVVDRSETTSEEVMKNLIQRFILEEEGQDLVEYAFLLVFIALVLVATITLTGTKIIALFQGVNSQIAAS
jgi:Flp pilus assembly pilin Flp